MKKALLLFFCAATVMLSSCKKEVISPETTNLTILSDIFPNDWKLTPDRLSYVVEISVPENDEFYNQNGSVVVAMSFENLNVYEALPQTYKGFSYRFTYEPGKVKIYLSDPYGQVLVADDEPTFESTAKISLLDGQLID